MDNGLAKLLYCKIVTSQVEYCAYVSIKLSDVSVSISYIRCVWQPMGVKERHITCQDICVQNVGRQVWCTLEDDCWMEWVDVPLCLFNSVQELRKPLIALSTERTFELASGVARFSRSVRSILKGGYISTMSPFKNARLVLFPPPTNKAGRE
ncbi:hypothetical protein J6590_047492 [Homalodisca vitripennis]|nr:hypothetical protein J6590_047492 [Homalodisca vitripennis]